MADALGFCHRGSRTDSVGFVFLSSRSVSGSTAICGGPGRLSSGSGSVHRGDQVRFASSHCSYTFATGCAGYADAQLRAIGRRVELFCFCRGREPSHYDARVVHGPSDDLARVLL